MFLLTIAALLSSSRGALPYLLHHHRLFPASLAQNGDAHLAAEPLLRLFDAGAFYTQHLVAIADSQWELRGTEWEGAVPDISPFFGDSKMPSDVTWAIAFPLLAAWMRAYYNDTRVVIQYRLVMGARGIVPVVVAGAARRAFPLIGS